VPTLLRDDHPQSRELRLGLTEKQDEFKFSDDVAPEARSEEDVSAHLPRHIHLRRRPDHGCRRAGLQPGRRDLPTPRNGGSEAYEGASGQVSVRENGNAEHKMTLLLAERD
jgi:hypothetical protein